MLGASSSSWSTKSCSGLAAGLLRRERPGHTLQPTALVHEALLRPLCPKALGRIPEGQAFLRGQLVEEP